MLADRDKLVGGGEGQEREGVCVLAAKFHFCNRNSCENATREGRTAGDLALLAHVSIFEGGGWSMGPSVAIWRRRGFWVALLRRDCMVTAMIRASVWPRSSAAGP